MYKSGTMLKAELSKRIAMNPSYSLRAFARDLGISHSYLSMILNGQRKLSPQKIVYFSSRLGLEVDKLKSYQGSHSLKKRALRERVDIGRYSDVVNILSHWYIFSIADLTLTEDFKDDPLWISRRLGINPHVVREAIDLLLKIKILKRDPKGKLFKSKAHIELTPKESLAGVRIFHEEFMKKAIEAMKERSPAAYQNRSITTDLIAVNTKKIPLIKKRIERFRQECVKELTQGEANEVMSLGVQFFPLTRMKS